MVRLESGQVGNLEGTEVGGGSWFRAPVFPGLGEATFLETCFSEHGWWGFLPEKYHRTRVPGPWREATCGEGGKGSCAGGKGRGSGPLLGATFTVSNDGQMRSSPGPLFSVGVRGTGAGQILSFTPGSTELTSFPNSVGTEAEEVIVSARGPPVPSTGVNTDGYL